MTIPLFTGQNYTIWNRKIDLWTLPNGNLDLEITKHTHVGFGTMDHVTIPFTYQPQPGVVTKGRLIIPIDIQKDCREPKAHDTHVVANAVKRIERTILANQGYNHVAFKAFIPFDTRSLGGICKSLFTPITCDHLKNTSGCGYLLGIVTLICDLATLPFRLVTLLFRCIYQSIKQNELEDVEVRAPHGGTIDWSRGEISFKTFGERVASADRDNEKLTLTNVPEIRVYLG